MASPPVTYVPRDLKVNILPLVSFGSSGSVSRIHQRLDYHPYITRFLGLYQGMLLLERLQYPLRKRLLDLRSQGQVPVTEDAVDISAPNILLDWDDKAKLSIDGCTPEVLPSIHAEHSLMACRKPQRAVRALRPWIDPL
ncbi:hypothetical protein MY11210_005026 [Beauveria gryllotalpidicola]